MADGDEDLPRDVKIVKTILKSVDVEDYEPRVIRQFLELCYRYVVDVLIDAQAYSEHARKTAIDCDDVKLAIQSKVNFSFSQPPPREVLLELARTRNKIPLPKTIAGPGIPLPPEDDTLISPNYQLVIPKKRPAPAQETEEVEEKDEGRRKSISRNEPATTNSAKGILPARSKTTKMKQNALISNIMHRKCELTLLIMFHNVTVCVFCTTMVRIVSLSALVV